MSFAAAVLRARVAVRALTTPTTAPSFAASTSGFGSPTLPLQQAESSSPTSSNNLTKSDLVKTIAETHELSKAQSNRILKTVLDTISESLLDKKSVRLAGLGTFSTYESSARKGRNPKTQESLDIPAKTRIRFRPNRSLKATMQPKE